MKKTKYIILIILTCILSIFLYNNYNNIKDYILHVNKIDTVYHTDTILKFDSIEIIKEKPVPKYIEVVKTDTFYKKDGSDTLIKTENKQYQDTFTCANDSIIIQNFISGINSNLDSTKVDWKRQETIITNTVEITKYIEKKRTFWNRLSIGPAVTAGYDPLNKQFATTIGFGVFFDIK